MRYYDRNRAATALWGLALWIPFIVLIINRVCVGLAFERNIGGHLKRAANANTVKLAHKELATALQHMEADGLTKGESHMLIYTPRCDVGFWYENIKAADEELVNFPKEADALTTSNQLMKLRETLLDDTGSGVKVTLPPNIIFFPDQLAWLFGWIITGGLAAVGFVLLCLAAND